MADELELELEENGVEKRIKDLSSKVKLTAQERDELATAKAQVEAEKENIAKERDFYKDFSQSTAKYPGASEYQDKILEKVKSGYTVEDATISILAKEGKFAPQTPPPAPKETVAGGSAPTNPGSQGQKSLSEMSKEDKRAMLLEAEQKGDIAIG